MTLHSLGGGDLGKHQRTDLDHARDELMSHIHRCGVLKAAPEHQADWLKETMEYMAERYPALSPEELSQLQQIGERFCQPVIPHGKDHTALEDEDTVSESNVVSESKSEEQGEMAGAA